MTPTEIRNALAEIAGQFSNGYAAASIPMSGPPLRLTIYPEGITKDRRVTVDAHDFAEGIAKLRTAVEAEREALDAEVVHRMALAIIEHADAEGGVTEAVLRLVASREQIARLKDRAVAKANEMAARGPFTIVETASANAPAEAAE